MHQNRPVRLSAGTLEQLTVLASRCLFFLALISITWLAVAPEIDSFIHTWDKLNHVAAFFVLALLLDFSYPQSRFPGWKGLLLLSYGVAIELFQSMLDYRDSSNADMAANCIGLLIYSITALWIHRLRFRLIRLLVGAD